MINVTGFKDEFLEEFSKINKDEMLDWFNNEEQKDKERRNMSNINSTKRLERRNITYSEIGYKSQGSMFDLLDNSLKTVARINDEQYDFIAENANDDELDLLVKEEFTFAEKRQFIIMLEKYLTQFNNRK